MIDITVEILKPGGCRLDDRARAGGLLGALVRPCKSLGPVLEKARGWNTRAASSWPKSTRTSSSNWPGMFGIRSIPCVLLRNSQPRGRIRRATRRPGCGPSSTSILPRKARWWPNPMWTGPRTAGVWRHPGRASRWPMPCRRPGHDDPTLTCVRLLIATGGCEEADALLGTPQAHFPSRCAGCAVALARCPAVRTERRPGQLAAGAVRCRSPRTNDELRHPLRQGPRAHGPRANGRLPWKSCWKSSYATRPGTPRAPRKTYVAILELLAAVQADPLLLAETAGGHWF